MRGPSGLVSSLPRRKALGSVAKQQARSRVVAHPIVSDWYGPWPLQRAVEVFESSSTRSKASSEKLLPWSRVRMAFRDASGRSESAYSWAEGDIADVVDAWVTK
jgi:hypothetical protein